jgi:hypothetical protein
MCLACARPEVQSAALQPKKKKSSLNFLGSTDFKPQYRKKGRERKKGYKGLAVRVTCQSSVVSATEEHYLIPGVQDQSGQHIQTLFGFRLAFCPGWPGPPQTSFFTISTSHWDDRHLPPHPAYSLRKIVSC